MIVINKETSETRIFDEKHSMRYFFAPEIEEYLSSKDLDLITCDDPEEAGLEMTQRILSAEPIQGFIKPYSRIPIKFLCHTKLSKKEKVIKCIVLDCYFFEYIDFIKGVL